MANVSYEQDIILCFSLIFPCTNGTLPSGRLIAWHFLGGTQQSFIIIRHKSDLFPRLRGPLPWPFLFVQKGTPFYVGVNSLFAGGAVIYDWKEKEEKEGGRGKLFEQQKWGPKFVGL